MRDKQLEKKRRTEKGEKGTSGRRETRADFLPRQVHIMYLAFDDDDDYTAYKYRVTAQYSAL